MDGQTHSQTQIKVGVVGAGSMGRGISFQVQSASDMELCWVVDKNQRSAEAAVKLAGAGIASDDFIKMITESPIDVLVEATNSIGEAADYCFTAFTHKAHVVLMNAEVDLALRPLLEKRAAEAGVTVTSDAGDQHGVLDVMIQEAHEMGFQIVQAGNIKGFLDRTATPESIKKEAEKRRLSAEQCCAYTDGTKLHIEMALLANAHRFLPPEGGMTGPRAEQVQEALEKFDFPSYGETPRIDYLLGAEPGGGVYLVVKPEESLPEEQAFYLNYYKLGSGPYYLLYRPYHLCHLETPKAIRRAVQGHPLLSHREKGCDVYAYAKRPLKGGETLSHAIGSAEIYGLVEPINENRVPIYLLEGPSILKKYIAEGSPLRWSDLEIEDSFIFKYWKEQGK